MISPALWREVFKPRYAEQFDLIHSLGKHIYFHSCGYIYDNLEINNPGDIRGNPRGYEKFRTLSEDDD